MNFFQHQDQAHRESKKLLFLFACAVVLIAFAVNLAMMLAWRAFKGVWIGPVHYPQGFFLINTALTFLFILGGSFFEMLRLREGGHVVAEMAGGRLIPSSSRDALERRLLNIVEEMSLAAGMACPRVYILDGEDAINAFAAGYHQSDAVVAVTRGSLTRLTRDELQGVVAHEFSHILNGDMRLNVRLISVLFGIQMVAGFGEFLMDMGGRFGHGNRIGRDSKNGSFNLAVLLVGVILYVVGYIGIFFGRMIKSAVSRQREYLADASAVQFTRNVDGIGGALRKIGGLGRNSKCGSRISHHSAEHLSHLYLGAARANFMTGWFATHPPLEERLQRLYGRSKGFLDADELLEKPYVSSPAFSNALVDAPLGQALAWDAPAIEEVIASRATASTPVQSVYGEALPFTPMSNVAMNNAVEAKAEVKAEVKAKTKNTDTISPELLSAARHPASACALVYALLLDRSDAQAYQIQQTLLQQSAAKQAALCLLLLENLERLGSLGSAMRMPLLDLAMPSLKALSKEQTQHFLGVVSRLIVADQKVSQAEFILQTVLQRRLSEHSGRVVAVRYQSLLELKNEVMLLLAVMAKTHSLDNPSKYFLLAQQALPEFALSAQVMPNLDAVDYLEVKFALDKLNQLAPLMKPFLIRALLQVAENQTALNHAEQDLLRCICAAIDSPVPEFLAVFKQLS
jgi:Zn-dependent protease with chaperone function